MSWTPKKFFGHGVVQNVVALYGVLACTYVLPIVTFPYLARVLGPTGWGSVVFAQAIGLVIAVFVEYGFDISASRETALHRDEPARLAQLISGVLGAKGLLAILCVAGAIFSRRFTQHIAPSQALFWASTAWGVCQGINMLWYFQGLERMRLASALEIGGKVVATLSIFLLVRHPDDGWKVLAAQCMGSVVAHSITVVLAYREVGFVWPTWESITSALRLGWSMFMFRAAQGLTTSINGLVLGAVASLAALGVYAGAERIMRVFQQALWPVNQALYPRLAAQLHANEEGGMKTVRISLYLLGGLSTVFGAVIFFGAPLFVHLVLGAAFKDSVPALRIFALWIPLAAVCTVLAFQLLLPKKLDRAFNFTTITEGVVSVLAAFLLAPRFQAAGIVWAAVLAQLYSLIAFIVILVRADLNPFSKSRRTLSGPPIPTEPIPMTAPGVALPQDE